MQRCCYIRRGGGAVAVARRDRGLTQAELAEQLGIDSGHLAAGSRASTARRSSTRFRSAVPCATDRLAEAVDALAPIRLPSKPTPTSALPGLQKKLVAVWTPDGWADPSMASPRPTSSRLMTAVIPA